MDLEMDKVQYEEQLILHLEKWQTANDILGPNLSETGLRNVMELLKETSEFLLSTHWNSVHTTTKNIIKDYIKQLVKSTEIISRISKSILLSFDDPWRLYNNNYGPDSTSDVIDIQFLEDEQDLLMEQRIRFLCKQNSVTSLSKYSIDCTDYLKNSNKFILDVCLYFLYKNYENQEQFIHQVKKLTFMQGISFLKRAASVSTEIHDFALDVLCAKALSNKIIKQDEYILIIFPWISVNAKHTNFSALVKRITKVATTSEHIYIFIQCLRQKKCKFRNQIILDLYITGITMDLNNLEILKSVKVFNCLHIIEFEKYISKKYIQLSELLKSYKNYVRELLLTAFSLNPCLEIFNQLDRSPLKKNHSAALFSISGEHYMSFFNYSEYETPNLIMDSAFIGEISEVARKDLTKIINLPRIKTLSWSIDWSQLSIECKKLMSEDSKLSLVKQYYALANKDLKYCHLSKAKESFRNYNYLAKRAEEKSWTERFPISTDDDDSDSDTSMEFEGFSESEFEENEIKIIDVDDNDMENWSKIIKFLDPNHLSSSEEVSDATSSQASIKIEETGEVSNDDDPDFFKSLSIPFRKGLTPSGPTLQIDENKEGSKLRCGSKVVLQRVNLDQNAVKSIISTDPVKEEETAEVSNDNDRSLNVQIHPPGPTLQIDESKEDNKLGTGTKILVPFRKGLTPSGSTLQIDENKEDKLRCGSKLQNEVKSIISTNLDPKDDRKCSIVNHSVFVKSLDPNPPLSSSEKVSDESTKSFPVKEEETTEVSNDRLKILIHPPGPTLKIDESKEDNKLRTGTKVPIDSKDIVNRSVFVRLDRIKPLNSSKEVSDESTKEVSNDNDRSIMIQILPSEPTLQIDEKKQDSKLRWGSKVLLQRINLDQNDIKSISKSFDLNPLSSSEEVSDEATKEVSNYNDRSIKIQMHPPGPTLQINESKEDNKVRTGTKVPIDSKDIVNRSVFVRLDRIKPLNSSKEVSDEIKLPIKEKETEKVSNVPFGPILQIEQDKLRPGTKILLRLSNKKIISTDSDPKPISITNNQITGKESFFRLINNQKLPIRIEKLRQLKPYKTIKTESVTKIVKKEEEEKSKPQKFMRLCLTRCTTVVKDDKLEATKLNLKLSKEKDFKLNKIFGNSHPSIYKNEGNLSKSNISTISVSSEKRKREFSIREVRVCLKRFRM